MPYVLYPIIGNTFPTEIGPLEGGTAYPITQEQAKKFKRVRYLVVFNKIAGTSEKKVQKELYGVTFKEKPVEELLTFQDFVSRNKGDMQKAKIDWHKYKLEKGLK